MPQSPHDFDVKTVITVGGFAGILLLALLCVYAAPRSDGDLAVIASPWAEPTTASLAIAKSGGALTGRGRWSFIALTSTHSPGYVGRLYASGAVIVIDAGVFGGCKG